MLNLDKLDNMELSAKQDLDWKSLMQPRANRREKQKQKEAPASAATPTEASPKSNPTTNQKRS